MWYGFAILIKPFKKGMVMGSQHQKTKVISYAYHVKSTSRNTVPKSRGHFSDNFRLKHRK